MPEDAEIRERILSRASEMFIADGVTHVGVDEIASELGISKKTLYKHFESKQELVTIVARRVMTETEKSIETIVRNKTPFLEKIDSFMSFVAARLALIGKPFLADIHRSYPEIWNEFQAFRRKRILTSFQRILTEGREQGLVRPEVNRDLFILSFLSAVESVITPSVLSVQSFSASEAIQGILRIFFQGMMTEEASRKFRLLQQHHSSS